MNLRWRIGTLVVSTTAAAVASVGVWVHVDAYDRALREARSSVRTDLNRAASVYANTGEVSGTGARLNAKLPAGLARLVSDGHRGTELVQGRQGREMWAARPAEGGTLSMSANVEPTLRALEALDASIAVAGALTSAVLLPAGAFTASRLSRRLRLAATTARQITHGDLDARIGAPERPQDEIDEISHAVDTMAAALQSRLMTEQRFTGDVAHELRTPLMGLLTAAENLPEGRITDLVRERVRALCSLTDDLLEISRLDSGVEEPEMSAWALRPLVEQAAARADVPFDLRSAEEEGDTPSLVRTDPRRFSRILANLLVNAHRHGKTPVEVTVNGTTVTVRDHGPGYPEELLLDGPQRFRSHTQERGRGHGLGLTIAVGQAQVIGARLRFGNAPDGGAQAVLVLPALHRTVIAGQEWTGDSPAVGRW